MTVAAPTPRDIHLARRRIAALIRRTPLLHSAALSERAGAAVYLKLENLQHTGSFKIRGAANKLLSLAAGERARGVVAVSSGNHGRAVAYVARQLGIRAVICVSERVPAGKIDAIRRLGAELVVHGATYDEAEAHSLRLQAEQGLVRVDPFDDPAVIAGQGTIGLELLEDLPQVDTVVVPLSGGGLISGIAIALEAASPAIRASSPGAGSCSAAGVGAPVAVIVGSFPSVRRGGRAGPVWSFYRVGAVSRPDPASRSRSAVPCRSWGRSCP